MKYEMNKMRTPILNSLKKHRKLMKYNQKDVARILNLHDTSQICRWEKGLSLPNTINLLKLSILYRTFPNELYFNLLICLRHEVIEMENFLLKKNDI